MRLQEVGVLITQRKAVWLGHAERAKDEYTLRQFDIAKGKNTRWRKELKKELSEYNTTPERIRELESAASIKRIFRPPTGKGKGIVGPAIPHGI